MTITESAKTMRVTATFGARFELCDIDSPTSHPVPARAKGKRQRPVTGDRVVARPLPGESDWQIESVESRLNELSRTDSRGRRETLAANVSMMVVVVASKPQPDWFVADRYLAAAELMPTKAAIVWNKADLVGVPDAVQVYRDIGYPVIETSVPQSSGIENLRSLMRGELSIFVGLSGVGKSSLINALSGNELQRTRAVSEANDEGRHTTVAARLMMFEDAVTVIDSPGVRDYAPALIQPERVASGFREILQASDLCRFADCSHRAEPDCEVKARVNDGRIDERRYKSYLRLAQLNRQLSSQRY
ncbi:MAG: ribosome small subunit-dependent GTPase A [Pseudomonadota bacterium]